MAVTLELKDILTLSATLGSLGVGLFRLGRLSERVDGHGTHLERHDGEIKELQDGQGANGKALERLETVLEGLDKTLDRLTTRLEATPPPR